MNLDGVVIGVTTFVLIGLLHPVVIKTEYYWGIKAWPLFMISGLVCIGASLITSGPVIPALLSITGFSLLWSIREIFSQRQRVKKGWYPQNPNKEK